MTNKLFLILSINTITITYNTTMHIQSYQLNLINFK